MAVKKTNQKGQALIELIVFLPLMFTFYSMISGFAGAINGSINQQKATRAYFYYRVQNNPFVPKPDEGDTHVGWGKFGMFFVGWMDQMQSDNPVAPCYRVSIPMANNATENCETAYSEETTQYIRVGTAYGICGATFVRATGGSGSGVAILPHVDGGALAALELTNRDSCEIKQ